VTKRLVEIDDEVLEEARRALGTVTMKDTVNTASKDAAQAHQRHSITEDDVRRFVEATPDLRDPEIMAKAWE